MCLVSDQKGWVQMHHMPYLNSVCKVAYVQSSLGRWPTIIHKPKWTFETTHTCRQQSLSKHNKYDTEISYDGIKWTQCNIIWRYKLQTFERGHMLFCMDEQDKCSNFGLVSIFPDTIWMYKISIIHFIFDTKRVWCLKFVIFTIQDFYMPYNTFIVV